MSADSLSVPDGQAVDLLRDTVIRLEAFERTGYAAQMLKNGIPVWPLVKYLLVKHTIFAMGRGAAATGAFDVYSDTLRRTDISRKGWLKRRRLWRRARRTDPAEILPALNPHIDAAEPDPVLLFGSASGFQDNPAGRVNVHHHALRTALATRGHRTLAFYADNPASSDLAAWGGPGGDVDLDPLIRHITGIAPFTAHAETFLRPVFPDLDQIVERTGHRTCDLCAYADILTGYMTTATFAMSTLLTQLRPQAVFLSNYASFYGWAMAHVCRQAGIACIDIQHGIEGRHNGAYHFASGPPDDWSIVPTYHLTWSQEDADFFTAQHPRRRAAVMGTHTGQLARLSDTPVPAALEALTAYSPVLLFTAQFASDILAARELHRKGLRVIFRSHPTRRDETHALVGAEDLNTLHCTIGSELPLSTLIQSCDGMITGYSATILEATAVGKPVFATGAFAELLAEDYTQALGGLLSVDPEHGGPGLADRLRTWAGTLPHHPDTRVTKPDLEAALEALQVGV